MIIEAKDIRKGFGSLEVLKGVSFSAQKGEVVSIVGASGAGKTTLLQILGTLSRPDSGALEIDGKDVLKMDEKQLSAFRCRKIGFVFQAHHLLPEFSALENVMMPALIAGRKTSEAKQAALDLLERVGLSDRADHKPSALRWRTAENRHRPCPYQQACSAARGRAYRQSRLRNQTGNPQTALQPSRKSRADYYPRNPRPSARRALRPLA